MEIDRPWPEAWQVYTVVKCPVYAALCINGFISKLGYKRLCPQFLSNANFYKRGVLHWTNQLHFISLDYWNSVKYKTEVISTHTSFFGIWSVKISSVNLMIYFSRYKSPRPIDLSVRWFKKITITLIITIYLLLLLPIYYYYLILLLLYYYYYLLLLLLLPLLFITTFFSYCNHHYYMNYY